MEPGHEESGRDTYSIHFLTAWRWDIAIGRAMYGTPRVARQVRVHAPVSLAARCGWVNLV